MHARISLRSKEREETPASYSRGVNLQLLLDGRPAHGAHIHICGAVRAKREVLARKADKVREVVHADNARLPAHFPRPQLLLQVFVFLVEGFLQLLKKGNLLA